MGGVRDSGSVPHRAPSMTTAQNRFQLNNTSNQTWGDYLSREHRIAEKWQSKLSWETPKAQTRRPQSSIGTGRSVRPYRYRWQSDTVPESIKDVAATRLAEMKPDPRNQGPRTLRATNCLSGESGGLGPFAMARFTAEAQVRHGANGRKEQPRSTLQSRSSLQSRGSEQGYSQRGSSLGDNTGRLRQEYNQLTELFSDLQTKYSDLQQAGQQAVGLDSGRGRTPQGLTSSRQTAQQEQLQLSTIREALKQRGKQAVMQERAMAASPFAIGKTFGDDVAQLRFDSNTYAKSSESGIMARHATTRKGAGDGLDINERLKLYTQ